MTKDALKFFQAYIHEMIDLGGNNLPKAIASKSGAKLAQVYKKKAYVLEITSALKQIYSALKGKLNITKLNENTYEVLIKYPKKFCPIGGGFNPSRASMFQNSICIPYTRGFLNELFPQYTTQSEILNCIPLTNEGMCHYILKVQKRNHLNNSTNNKENP